MPHHGTELLHRRFIEGLSNLIEAASAARASRTRSGQQPGGIGLRLSRSALVVSLLTPLPLGGNCKDLSGPMVGLVVVIRTFEPPPGSRFEDIESMESILIV